MNIEAFATPTIAVAVWVLMELIKRFGGDKEKWRKWLPAVAAALGSLIGAGMFFAGFLTTAETVRDALFTGLCSGLCATGTDRLIRFLLVRAKKELPREIMPPDTTHEDDEKKE